MPAWAEAMFGMVTTWKGKEGYEIFVWLDIDMRSWASENWLSVDIETGKRMFRRKWPLRELIRLDLPRITPQTSNIEDCNPISDNPTPRPTGGTASHQPSAPPDLKKASPTPAKLDTAPYLIVSGTAHRQLCNAHTFHPAKWTPLHPTRPHIRRPILVMRRAKHFPPPISRISTP
ncbi:hypothetical protein CC78DRAFT_586114 [Lojkania enalia]|uniref:Uncharacterized protein n=1 Tax=Lojkania enalia TaxID=147567 RepID=A0A9P4JZL9_9PLEO|nr:hypothetical protein CC78DRAFT_586114 [Didymosphaeria enalia]